MQNRSANCVAVASWSFLGTRVTLLKLLSLDASGCLYFGTAASFTRRLRARWPALYNKLHGAEFFLTADSSWHVQDIFRHFLENDCYCVWKRVQRVLSSASYIQVTQFLILQFSVVGFELLTAINKITFFRDVMPCSFKPEDGDNNLPLIVGIYLGSFTAMFFILIWSFLLNIDLPNGFFPLYFPNNILHEWLISSVLANCKIFVTLNMLDKKCRLWGLWLCNFILLSFHLP